MSFHNKPNYQIPELIEALKAHRLPHDTPSQLADSFRIGWMACRDLAQADSGFDYKTAADFLSGKTVSDEALRKFVAASRGAHDARAALHAKMLSLQGELASREAEIALLKRSLLDAEAAFQPSPKAAPVTQQAGYAEVIECGNSYAKVKLKGEAFGSTKVGDIFYTAPQQEATKAAPGELKDHQILAITTAYEQGVGKGHQAYKSGKEIANPYDSAYGCDLAWQYGYGEGKEQAQRATKAAAQQEAQEPAAWQGVHDQTDLYYTKPVQADVRPLYTAPQPAPAPLSEMPYEKRKAIQEGEQISASDAWFKARHEMLDTVDRRNVFRAGFDRGWNAAIAAQGGK